VELLALAPDPVSARRLTRARDPRGAATHRGRRNLEDKATRIHAALRSDQLSQAAASVVGYAAVTHALAGLIKALNSEIGALEKQVTTLFDDHPDAEIYRSQPGIAAVLGGRMLGEFGDDAARDVDARARKNYAGSSPITRASGKKKTVTARHVGNQRLLNAIHHADRAGQHRRARRRPARRAHRRERLAR